LNSSFEDIPIVIMKFCHGLMEWSLVYLEAIDETSIFLLKVLFKILVKSICYVENEYVI